MTNMTIAVTGGGGFIGSYLVRALADGKNPVRTLLGPKGAPVVLPPEGVENCCGDIWDAAILARLFEDVSAVVHLAGPPSVAASFRASVEYARAHVSGTAAVVDACIRVGVPRLVYVSSAEVYGQPLRNPVDEDAPQAPRSPYAAAKIGAEAFVRAGARSAGLEAVIGRPFLVYGPGMPATSLVGSLVRQARQGNLIELFDPRPIRDYCFVADLTDALIACCRAALPAPVRVFNLGSGQGLSVADLARRVLALSGGEGEIRIAESPDRPPGAAILELVSDPSRAARELGWRASTTIESGIAEMLRMPLEDNA